MLSFSTTNLYGLQGYPPVFCFFFLTNDVIFYKKIDFYVNVNILIS